MAGKVHYQLLMLIFIKRDVEGEIILNMEYV